LAERPGVTELLCRGGAISTKRRIGHLLSRPPHRSRPRGHRQSLRPPTSWAAHNAGDEHGMEKQRRGLIEIGHFVGRHPWRQNCSMSCKGLADACSGRIDGLWYLLLDTDAAWLLDSALVDEMTQTIGRCLRARCDSAKLRSGDGADRSGSVQYNEGRKRLSTRTTFRLRRVSLVGVGVMETIDLG